MSNATKPVVTVFQVTLDRVNENLIYVTDRSRVHKIVPSDLRWMNHSPFESALRSALQKFMGDGLTHMSYDLTMHGNWDYTIKETAPKIDTEDCPRWQADADNFLSDPITREGSVGSEMLHLVKAAHIKKCGLCGTGTEITPVAYVYGSGIEQREPNCFFCGERLRSYPDPNSNTAEVVVDGLHHLACHECAAERPEMMA